MNSYEKLKDLLGQELVDSVYAIKEDENKLNILSSLCAFLLNNKRVNDFEKLKNLLVYQEDILIRINGSKYLNRFSDFDVILDEENSIIDLKAEILNGTIGTSLNYRIYEVVNKDSIYFCKDIDGDSLILDFATPVFL